MTMKETVCKYRNEIDELVRDIRRWITEHEKTPDTDEIRAHTEDVFFASEL